MLRHAQLNSTDRSCPGSASVSPLFKRHGVLQRGFSLVELMVALTIGLILLAGLTTILINNSRAHDEISRANQQIENGTYAMEVITDDLSNAGYFAEFDPTVLTAPTTLPDVCDTTIPNLKAALPVSIQGYDNDIGVPSTCSTSVSDVRTATDVLVIRRVSTCVAGNPNCDPIVAGDPYFQASLCSGATELGSIIPTSYFAMDTATSNLLLHKRDCTTLADLHRYETHIYFIANNDNPGDGIPTLKVAELSNGSFTTSSLVAGIENMQLEYGLDTNGDGQVDVYTADPNSYSSCDSTTSPTCVGNWQNTMAVKIHILSRSLTQSPGLPDDKTYILGLKANGTTNSVGPISDDYKRHVFESTVTLYNAAGRRS